MDHWATCTRPNTPPFRPEPSAWACATRGTSIWAQLGQHGVGWASLGASRGGQPRGGGEGHCERRPHEPVRGKWRAVAPPGPWRTRMQPMSSSLLDQVDAGSLNSVAGPAHERVALVMSAHATFSRRQARLGACNACRGACRRSGAKGAACTVCTRAEGCRECCSAAHRARRACRRAGWAPGRVSAMPPCRAVEYGPGGGPGTAEACCGPARGEWHRLAGASRRPIN